MHNSIFNFNCRKHELYRTKTIKKRFFLSIWNHIPVKDTLNKYLNTNKDTP